MREQSLLSNIDLFLTRNPVSAPVRSRTRGPVLKIVKLVVNHRIAPSRLEIRASFRN